MNKEETLERVPPQAVEVEQAVLGAMLIESEAIGKVVEILDETAFYREGHRKIFRAVVSLYERNEAVDLVTMSEELKKRKQLDDLGGSYYLTELVQRVSSAANVEYHARIVLEKSLLRKLITVSTQITSEGYEAQESAFDLLDRAEQMIFGLSDTRHRRGFMALDPILHDTFETIESYHGRKGVITGVSSGFDELDQYTAGFQPSDLIVVAGRPATGKTAFCLNMAREAAVEHKVPVGIFSMEMASRQVAMRLLCSEARVSSHAVRTGRLRDEEWQKLSLSVGSLAEAPIYVDDTPNLGILEVRAKARRLKSEHSVGFIIVDYLQLMQPPSDAESQQQAIAKISRALKGLARELDIPVIAVSQLSRAVESRGGDRRPMLSDLRDSGAIEQDADVVMFIYRSEMYKGKIPAEHVEEGIAEVIIGKHRNGPTGTVKLTFIRDYARFETMERFEEEVISETPF
ncbi:replicative DNA helicase [candidate division KSB1 bacterium]|nr:replicative DNA helicase [candidate division KSB1 bacterium]